MSKERTAMLARRFTIICLLMSLFGMFFAMLVADGSHPSRGWDQPSSARCPLVCLNQLRR
jgi:hypothetical protein